MFVVKSLERLGVPLLGLFDQLGFVRVVALELAWSLYWVGQVAFSGRTP